jgi:hypothetical protein
MIESRFFTTAEMNRFFNFLNYNRQKLYKFELYMLFNIYMQSGMYSTTEIINISIILHTCFFEMRILKIYYSRKYKLCTAILLAIVTMLNSILQNWPPKLFHLKTAALFPLPNISPFPPTPGPWETMILLCFKNSIFFTLYISTI